MKKILIVAGIFVLGCVIYCIPASMAVEICHSPPGDSSNWHTIDVHEKHVDFHLAHGDQLGPCTGDEACLELFDDGNPCTVARCDPEGGFSHQELKNCDDGRECTTDVCSELTGYCEYVVNCDEGEECGYNTGECVGCPVEARIAMNAATSILSQTIRADESQFGEVVWLEVECGACELQGWPPDVPSVYVLSKYSYPADTRDDGVVSFVSQIGVPIYPTITPKRALFRGVSAVWENDSFIFLGQSNWWEEYDDPTDLRQLDDWIVCAKKVAQAISDITGQPCGVQP